MYTITYSKLVTWVDHNSYLKRNEQKRVIQFLKELKPKSVLDFGCNQGYFAERIRTQLNVDAFGADINESALAKGEALYPGVTFVYC